MVVSGINIGENIGHGRILSSGTIGAAMESSIDGVISLSSSFSIPNDIKKEVDFFNPKNYKFFDDAAKITLKMVRIIIDKDFGEDVDLFSLNIPFDATLDSAFEITKPFRTPYGRLFKKSNGKYIHSNPVLDFRNLENGTDIKAIHSGRISITPISLELVSRNSLNTIRKTIE